jgi:hypothetical protein
MIVVRECKEEHALVCYGRFVIWCNSGWRAVPNRAWLTDYACTDRPRCGMVASDVDTTRRRGDALVFWAHVHRPATVGPSNHYWIVSSYARVLLSFFKKKQKKFYWYTTAPLGSPNFWSIHRSPFTNMSESMGRDKGLKTVGQEECIQGSESCITLHLTSF